jgi:hypothetical protein
MLSATGYWPGLGSVVKYFQKKTDDDQPKRGQFVSRIISTQRQGTGKNGKGWKLFENSWWLQPLKSQLLTFFA